MAGKTAILAIRIISDASKAAKELQTIETRGERMGRRMQKAGRVAGLGLLALAAAGGKAAKAAAEDQKGQALLANTLKRTTNATKSQLSAVETWIDKTARAKGVADDELRPALDSLVGSTKNVAQAQKLLGLAMDVSARTGKPLQTVSDALAKGYAGNTTALGRLVPGISKAALKSKDFDRIQKELAKTTSGAASTAADAAAGKYARMQITFGELQEQLGAFLLPILMQLAGVLAQVATFVQANSTTVAILVGALAGLAASVIAINTAYKSYKAITQAAKTAQLAFNIVLAANPIGLIIVAIIALAAGFVLAYKKSSTFRGIVQATGRIGKAAIGWVVDKAKSLWEWLGKLGPAMNAGKKIAQTAFKVYTTPIRTVIDLVMKLVGWIKRIKFPKIPGGIKKIAGLAGAGGGPTSPTTPRRPSSGGGGAVPGWGAGGPSGSGFTVPVGGADGYGAVVFEAGAIQISGAHDKEGVARELRNVLNGSLIRRGKKPVYA